MPPKAIFDTSEFLADQTPTPDLSAPQLKDFHVSRQFLLSYIQSDGTFRSYRREVERLLQWTWFIEQKSLKDLKRDDIIRFVSFCKKPPKHWISLKIMPRFIDKDGLRNSNPTWRPFHATQSKAARKQGEAVTKDDFSLSDSAVKSTFRNLSSFFQFLIIEEYLFSNPVLLIRQKSRFLKQRQGAKKIRRLSNAQWQAVLDYAQSLAEQNPQMHERTLFMVSALFAMYLRISELLASDRWAPNMNDFHKDANNRWWFTTVGKGNKERDIAVSDAMITALKRWRKYLGLSALPTPADNTPLIPKLKGKGPLSDSTVVRKYIQLCFDGAAERLQTDGEPEEANALLQATVHWLRHTGISEDVKNRPREHVRDDAGHGSGAITDHYIDIELSERHKSAKKKPLECN